jgi:hypothetical protein
MPSIQEHMGVIVRIESYFEHDDKSNRIMVDFIGEKGRLSINGLTSELDCLVDFLNEEIEKANKRKYIP